jgi:MFS superfamily sulfate permease-like transporter
MQVPPLVESSLGSYVHLAATLAFYSGLLQLVCGLLGVGVYAARVPPSMLQGFTTGAAFTVAVMQVSPDPHTRTQNHTPETSPTYP